MKKLVIYDSIFGNTKKVAEVIGETLGSDTTVKKASKASNADLKNVHVLIVGSPTRGFRPTEDITRFLNNLPYDRLKSVEAGAFDTRILIEDINPNFLRFIIKLGGYADRIIARKLKRAGATISVESTGFAVAESEGPLKEGELERAAAWAEKFLK